MSGSIFPLTTSIQGRYVKILYLDINTNYTQDNQQLLLENANAVNNELLNLLMTVPGELHFEPDFGSQIPNLLFEQPTTVVNWMMNNYMLVAISRWLPYVIIDTRKSSISPLANQVGYYFQLYYSVQGLTGAQVDFRFQT